MGNNMNFIEEGKLFIGIPVYHVFDLIEFLERNQLHGTLYEKMIKDIILEQLYEICGEGADVIAEDKRKKEELKNKTNSWINDSREENKQKDERRRATTQKKEKIKEVIKET
jgi:hypothetical protein